MAQAISSGLGDPTDRVPATALAAAAELILPARGNVTSGMLHRRARYARDELDQAGILDRENTQLDSLYLKAWRRLTPPRTIDPDQTPIPIPTKNPLLTQPISSTTATATG